MIYLNGDSHSAGAEIIENYAFAQDDPLYLAYGRRAHPEAVVQTYGYRVAQAVNQGFFCEAESGSSNDRIIRTTRNFINNTTNKKNVHIIIGWSTWEREEWQDGEDYIQITSSGTDSVPEGMEEEYKEWVVAQTEKELDKKTALWHKRIYDFHMELRDQNIKHTFFNTYLEFDNITVPVSDRREWHNQFINPYDKDYTYFYYLKNKGFDTVNENSYHYGIDGHREWTKVVLENYLSQYRIKSSPNYNRSKFPMLQKVQPVVDKKRNL